METKKSKVFTKKLISLFLAVLMAVTSLFGAAFSAQAYQKGGYNDTNVKSNLLAWVDATDDQTLEALLDYLDDLLANMDWDSANETTGALDIESKIPSALKSFIALSIDLGHLPHIKIQASTKGLASSVGLDVTIEGDANSIDGIIDVLFSLKEAILGSTGVKAKASSIANIAGFDLSVIGNINFDVFGNYFHNSIGTGAGYKANDGSYRTRNSAKYIIKGLLKWLLKDNYNNGTSSSLVRNLLYGSLEILPGKRDTLDIYGLLEGLLGMEDWEKDSNDLAKYQLNNGIVYNFLKVLIMKNVPIYGDDITVHEKDESSWVYDTEAYKIANYFLGKISFEITYPQRVDFGTEQNNFGVRDSDGNIITGYREDSSKRRYAQAVAAGKFDEATGTIDADYATAQGWDPKLVYSTETGYEGNVLVAQYKGESTFTVSSTDTVHSIVMRALPRVWKTALRDTIQLLHVNYNGHDEHGTNFDNAYYYWVSDNIGWNRSNWAANYTQANLNAYAAAKYADYGFSSAAEFIDYIEYTLTYKESRAAKNDKYNWRDIDASILFNELRYSPLADKVFNIQTGPCNLYFSQTGCANILNFFDNTFSASGTVIGQIDDALVEAMKDFFPTTTNVGKTVYNDATGEYTVQDLNLPALAVSSSETVSEVVATLVSDAGLVFQFAADSTDANMLNPYYSVNGYQTITEDNLEEAIIPFAISALKHWSLTESIHDSDWDKVCDIESGAVLALQEYLKHTYPERDYSQYYDYQVQNVVVGGQTVATYKYIVAKQGEKLLEDVIVPMAGDALLFVVTAAGVPVYQQTPGATTVVTEGYNNSGNATILDPYNYTFFGKGSGLNNVLWQTINGVACYFAVDKGVAGAVNLQGQVTKTKTVWQNLDTILNALLPALPQVFPLAAESNAFSSKKLIWDQVVEGVADVKTNKLITNVLSYVGNLLVCTPIKTTKVLNFAIFDVVKPLINLVLGSRTGTANIITQTASTTNPVDAFLKRGYLIDTAVNNLIGNLYAVLYNSDQAYSQSFYNAAALLLNALHILPKLNDNRIGGVSAKLKEHAFTSTSVDVKMDIRNESWGFASFYKDASGNTVQRGRYDAQILNYKVYNTATGAQVNNFTIEGDGDFAAVTALPAEAYTRVRIRGTAAMNTLYTVEVNYSMTAKNTVSGGVTKTYSAKAIDFLYVGNKVNEAWTEAYDGNNISLTAADSLVTKYETTNALNYTVPKYVGLGVNAGGAEYTYKVTNKGSAATVANAYATVAANTANYYTYDDNTEGYVPSSASSNNAYVAINKAGEILDSNGDVVALADEYINADDNLAMGYILDADDHVQAITVDPADIGGFKKGTPLKGVYLDTTSVSVDAQETEGSGDDQTVTDGEANVRIFSSTSQDGLDVAYSPMTLRLANGRTFGMTISTGNIDGPYGDYKGLAAGLANHYRTSDDSTAYNAVKSDLNAALLATIANGINASNIAENIDVEEARNNLEELAIANRSVEVDDLTYFVIETRRGRNNINYTSPANYEKSVDIAKEAEALVVAKAQTETEVDVEGNTITKEKRDADGNIIYDYYSYEPSIKLQEAARIYSEIYEPQAVLKTYSDSTVGKLAVDEVAHATSLANEYDETIAATANSYSDFTATVITDGDKHAFPYSTAEGHEYDLVDDYAVYATSADIQLKYGAVDTADNNKLINTVYTAESWKTYVDALGETVAAIKAHATQHDLYEARCHLVMAENNLEEGSSEGLTIKGTVFIAKDAAGTTGDKGAREINFMVDGEYVLDENGQPAVTSSEANHFGEFEIVVPERTTEITICGASTVDRTVTLSGTQDINNADIKVVTCNYKKDSKINALDLAAFKAHNNMNDEDAVIYNLNNDAKVNALDLAAYKVINNQNVEYAAQSLD